MQDTGTVWEIVRIRSELNCIHQYFSILHETSLGKYKFFFLIFIYICAGEHDDNIISLHEIDWKTKIFNRNISLMLLATLKIVSCLKIIAIMIMTTDTL